MDKIICVGKNYLDHALEMGDAVPEMPVLFLKPPSSATYCSQPGDTISVKLPRDSGAIHPECEIVMRLDSQGRFDAVTLGLDMTLREVQTNLKKKGHPWELAKVFQGSAVIGPWIELKRFSDYLEIPFLFLVNQSIRQKACGKEMRVSPENCLSYARKYFPICEGDLLFTGTPAGVSAVSPGQVVELKWGDRFSYSVRFE